MIKSWRFMVIFLSCAFSLSACTTVREVPVQVEGIKLPSLPDDDFNCLVEPDVPLPKNGDINIRESQLKNYIIDLIAAGRDCRSKLEIARKTWRLLEESQRNVSRAIRPAE